MSQSLTKALTHYQNKRFDSAEEECEQALAENPDNADAHLLMAVLRSRNNDHYGSAQHLESAISLAPHMTEARFNLGKTYRALGRSRDAAETFEHVSREWPERYDVWTELGFAYGESEEKSDSITAFERAIELGEKSYKAWHSLGTAYLNNAEYERANNALQHAVDLEPSFAPSWTNLAITLENQQQIDASLEIYQALLKNEPNYHDAAFRHALALLTAGNLEAGWAAYARRNSWPRSRTSHDEIDIPYWLGEELSGESLLIWTEQGPGDEILMGSMICDMTKLCEDITIACSARLAPIFSRTFPSCRIVVRIDTELPKGEIGEVSVQASLTELGRNLRPNTQSFSESVPYLKIDEDRRDAMRSKYRSVNGGRPLIGISWRSENEVAGKHKSTELKQWKDILSAGDADFISLQYGDTLEEIGALEDIGVRRLLSDSDIDPLVDMDAFTHQVAAMDLVISTSNTTVHVAGATGREVWTLVPEGMGRPWYWFLDRSDSLWYPSMKLYRQPQAGDWATPLSAVHNDLMQWMQNWSVHKQT